MPELFFEDIRVGEVTTFGHEVVDRAEMVAFARAFDAQPMHLDEVVAASSPIGRLIGSGWFSCALQMRMLCKAWILKADSRGGMGIPELRWLRPVLAGETLSARQTILEARVLNSRPDRGLVRLRVELLGQDGEPAMSVIHLPLIGLRGSKPERIAAPALATAEPEPAFPAEDPATAPRFYDHVVIGRGVDLGPYRFDEAVVFDFARRYDMQLFHLDREAAARGPFGALAASGWHTAAAWMSRMAARLDRMAETGERSRISVSPGYRDLRWLRPVLVGETIRFATEPVEKRPLASRPGWGLVTSRNTGRNGRGEEVFSFLGSAFWQMREG